MGTTRSKSKVDSANERVATQKVVYNRVLIYKYPKNCIDPLARKAFRRKVRDERTKLTANIAKLRGEERVKAKEKLQKYEEKYLSQA